MVEKKNLIDMSFGSLTVIKAAGSNKDGRALWLTRCICGEEKTVTGKALLKKSATMCPKKCVLTQNLTGQRFGNLLVLRMEGQNKHGFRRCLCRCVTPLRDIENDRQEKKIKYQDEICGQEFLVDAGNLKQSAKKLNQRKIPKSCEKCARILGGKHRRAINPLPNLTGQTFGRLNAIRRIYRGEGTYKRPMYECKCDCGSGLVTFVRQEALIGKTVPAIRSCGCLRMEALKTNKTALTHGLSAHPLYSVRSNMIKRCYDSKCSAYKQYGGRGIEMCNAWLEDVTSFYHWAIENGWTKGLTIDRIDNDGPYSPENCQIISRSENSLKMHQTLGSGFFVGSMQINIKTLSEKSKVSTELCKKLLANGYSENDVFGYGKLTLHQKNAVGRSISTGCPLSISAASKKKRSCRIRPPQSSEMGSYRAMMARCYNSKTSSYLNYGGKGIIVCTRWKNNPKQFLQDMGPKPEPKKSYVIDRIDPRKGYFPDNCRWVKNTENSRRVYGQAL